MVVCFCFVCFFDHLKRGMSYSVDGKKPCVQPVGGVGEGIPQDHGMGDMPGRSVVQGSMGWTDSFLFRFSRKRSD